MDDLQILAYTILNKLIELIWVMYELYGNARNTKFPIKYKLDLFQIFPTL